MTKQPGAGRPLMYPQGHVSRSLSLDRRADAAVATYAEQAGLSRSQAASRLILAGKWHVDDFWPPDAAAHKQEGE